MRCAVFYGPGSASPLQIIRSLSAGYEIDVFFFEGSDIEHSLLKSASDLFFDCRKGGVAAYLAVWSRRIYDTAVCFSEKYVREAQSFCRLAGVCCNPHEVVLGLTDKLAQRQRLMVAGCPVPYFESVRDASQFRGALSRVGFPAVLKPLRGAGSELTFALHDHEDAQEALSLWRGSGSPPMILEERLVGRPDLGCADYVSVESVVCDGQIINLGVTGKLPLVSPFRETCSFWAPEFLHFVTPDCHEATRSALEALRVQYGVFHTELKLTADGPVVIEVNGRLGGFIADLILRYCGFDMIAAAASVGLGRTSDSIAGKFLECPRRDGFHFTFNSLPLDGATELMAIDGAAQVRSLPWVVGYTAIPGSLPSVSTSTRELDVLRGWAPTYQDMRDRIRDALSLLQYSFALSDGSEVSVSGLELPSFHSLDL